ADAWQLAYFLKYVVAGRITKGREIRDAATLASMYEHELFRGLHDIFFLREPDVDRWKRLLDDLADQVSSLSKVYGVAQSVDGCFTSFKRVTKSFPPDAERELFLDERNVSKLLLDETIPLPRGFSEKLALLVMQSVSQSEEFRNKIENYIHRTIEFCRREGYTKFDELRTLIEWTERYLMGMGPRRLKEQEVERLRYWTKLIGRYGQDDVDLFLELFDGLNAEEFKLFGEGKLDTFSSGEWVQRELEERLKAKGLFERYMKEKFSLDGASQF
ncbi:MAG: hypothetical protein V1850_07415, partial [Candidatus Bathyarchaeota archaeon]